MPARSQKTLVLVPTELEERRLLDQGGWPDEVLGPHLCGFGPVAAAARTAQLLAEHRPKLVLLVGIAGAYDVGQNPVGTAIEFGRVALAGVGAGEGESAIGPSALGFPQWPGQHGTPPIIEELPLEAASQEGLPTLLTTCSASDSPEHAAVRRRRFPAAVAEDMEAFAVASACSLFGTRLAVVRGISNEVGDRDPAHWRIPSALSAARERALAWLQRGPAK